MCFCLAKQRESLFVILNYKDNLVVNASLIVLISLNRGIPYRNEMEVQSPNTLKNKCWSAGVACNNSALTILKQTIRKFSFKPIIASSILMKKEENY